MWHRHQRADHVCKLRRGGWNAHGVQANMCTKKCSAGVSVTVRSSFGSGEAAGQSIDGSPPDSPGRLACAWVDGIVRGGILLLSMYLWHSEGLSRRNMNLLCAAGERIVRHGGPWMIGADFNLPPDELAQASAWLSKLVVS